MIGRSDDLTGAMLTIAFEHERVHSGKTFQTHYKSPDASPIADNAAVNILIKTTTIPIHFMFSATGGGNLEILFFENTTVTGDGQGLSVIGMNRFRSLAPKTTAFFNPTITNDGDTLFNGFDSRGVGLATPEARQGTEWILKTNTNYLIRIINRAGGARDIAVVAQWYQAL
jgi:hypothetical protein